MSSHFLPHEVSYYFSGHRASLLQNTKRKENYFFTDFVLVQFKEDTEEKAGVSPSKECLQIAYQGSLYTT